MEIDEVRGEEGGQGKKRQKMMLEEEVGDFCWIGSTGH
jgi:hypothetical protein